MAVRYVQRRLNGGGRSIEEVEPPPESLEVSKYFSSVQRYIKIKGCNCGPNREVICLWVSMRISLSSSQCIAHPIQMPLTHSSTGCLTMHPMMSLRQKHDPSLISLIQGQDDYKALVLVPNTSTSPSTEPRNKDVGIDIGSDSEFGDSNEVRILGSFTSLDLPLAATTPMTSTSWFGESPLSWQYPPVSCITPSGRHLIFSRGETTDDERTETDEDVLPSPPPPQQSLEQQLAAVVNEINYWSKVVNIGIQGEPERPDWLPEGWEMKCVTRTNGSSAGNRDKFYIEPGVKRRQFRSKREVLEFLETGKRRQYKHKRKANSTAMPSTVNRPFEGTSSSSWQIIRTATHLEASTSRQNEEIPNLDSNIVPEKQNEETPPV